MDVDEIIKNLESLGDPEAVQGMARFGISAETVYGVSMPRLRSLSKAIGTDHDRALALWRIPSRETRILAALTADRNRVTEELMEEWVRDFDSWEICDQTLLNLFDRTPFARAKAVDWSFRDEEFVKRAGFVLMARLATVDKKAEDAVFLEFFPHIRRGAEDGRNYVKKAVNWALRQIGKRNLNLNRKAVAEAEAILRMDSASARWAASDALRELRSDAVQERLEKREAKKG
jgi:3-methyladenine DNA glycosylase AlkD